MTHAQPAVSIVLPVREPSREFLIAAVRSVLGQTLVDTELLVIEAVCAGAVPATAILANELADTRLRILRLAECSLVEQLNAGLRESRATYIARMDGDDICLPRRLEVQRQFLDAHPDVDVVGSHIAIIDSTGRGIGVRRYPTDHDAIVAAMQRYNPLAHPAVMFRRQPVLDAGGYRNPDRAAQDYDLWARMANAGRRFANFDGVLLEYRVHQGAIKARRVRDTLESTLRTKQEHFGASMSLRGKWRMLAERVALRVPPALVVRAYTWVALQRLQGGPDAGSQQRRSTVQLVASTGVSAAMSMAYMTLAARRLGPAEAAHFYAALFVVFSLLTVFGPASGAVSHFAAVCHATGEVARSAAVVRWMIRRLMVAGLLLAVPLYLSADAVTGALRLDSQWTLYSAYLITGSFVWLTLRRSVLRGGQQFAAYSSSLAGEPLLRLILGIGVLQVATNASLALLPYSVSALAAAALLGRSAGEAHAQRVEPGTIRLGEILRYAGPMTIVCLADAVYQNADILGVKVFCAPQEAGLYSAVASVTRTLGVLVTPFVARLLPMVSNLHERRLAVDRALLRACGGFVALGAPLLVVFGLWPEFIIGSLFGEAFVVGAPLLLPLGASALLGHLALLMAQAFLATRQMAPLIVYLVGAGLEMVALGLWHQSPSQMVMVVLVFKAAAAGALVGGWVVRSKGAPIP